MLAYMLLYCHYLDIVKKITSEVRKAVGHFCAHVLGSGNAKQPDLQHLYQKWI